MFCAVKAEMCNSQVLVQIMPKYILLTEDTHEPIFNFLFLFIQIFLLSPSVLSAAGL